MERTYCLKKKYNRKKCLLFLVVMSWVSIAIRLSARTGKFQCRYMVQWLSFRSTHTTRQSMQLNTACTNGIGNQCSIVLVECYSQFKRQNMVGSIYYQLNTKHFSQCIFILISWYFYQMVTEKWVRTYRGKTVIWSGSSICLNRQRSLIGLFSLDVIHMF